MGAKAKFNPLYHLLGTAMGWGGNPPEGAGYDNVVSEKNDQDAYSYNNVTAKKNTDGSITINFGKGPDAVNNIPITPGWNYAVRMYQPRNEIIDGTWKFPAAQPVE